MKVLRIKTNPSKNRRAVVYVEVKGENLLENFGNRAARPYKIYKPLVIQALKDAGIPFEKLEWSRTAGCRCGCSPGVYYQGSELPHRMGYTFRRHTKSYRKRQADFGKPEGAVNYPTLNSPLAICR